MTGVNDTRDGLDNRQRDLYWHKVADKDELDEGQVMTCPVGLKTVAVTKLHGRYGAIDNRCPHKQGPLSEGIVHGASVTCPLHNWVFDLATGKALGADEGQVRTYPIDLVDGRIFMAMESVLVAAE